MLVPLEVFSGIVSTPQAPILTGLMPHSTNYRIAESSFQLGSGSIGSGTCHVTDNCDILVTCDSNGLF